MKLVQKKNEPAALTVYRNALPDSTWDQMKNDPNFSGQQAYAECRAQLLADQKGLCAFCEIDIRDNDPLKCHVEHFHPKSDLTTRHNWALDWQNMLAVCAGGSYQYVDFPHAAEPLQENLSCDQHKDKMIQSGKLSFCEGWILNPLQIQAFPCLFQLEKSTGKLLPNVNACNVHPILQDNQHHNLAELVQHTIDMLNLNCDRLSTARRALINDIEHQKKRQRQQGFSPAEGLSNLVERYFSFSWRGFFTTIRICLDGAADAHLRNINFQG